MLDFGWAELIIIMAVAVFVIGPKDIPNLMYGLGRLVRRFQYIKYAVSQQFDDLMNIGDIEELQKGVNFEHRRNDDDVNAEIAEDEQDTEIDLLSSQTEEKITKTDSNKND